MNGLYIHVPFCRRRCVYCDFYSTTQGEEARRAFVESICHEMELRADFLPSRELNSLYIGGGTPSQLSADELQRLFETVALQFRLRSDAEVTIEVNPDDVTTDYVVTLRQTPVNRVSLGVQTFDDRQLHFLQRRHTARQAVEAVGLLSTAGFDNLSVDLIYGLPGQRLEQWDEDVRRAIGLPICHLSAYALIYEEGTRLWQLRESGRVCEASDELSLQMFSTLIDLTEAAGYEHYEISNFARHGRRARHNAGYWADMCYLGLGPGAHSYDGERRQWNRPNLEAYLNAGGDVEGYGLCEREVLTKQMMFNEILMKRLRTSDGLRLPDLQGFPEPWVRALRVAVAPYEKCGHLFYEPRTETIRLTRAGIFLSDGIISDLMRV